MPISIVMWIMMMSLVVTYILLNVIENKKLMNADGHLEKGRRNFTYTHHIPERRSDNEMKMSDRRFENDRRHFTYDTHIPERRSGSDRRLNYMI
jgi:hypothetical protein